MALRQSGAAVCDVRRGSRASFHNSLRLSVVRPIATRIETSAGRANGTHLVRNFRNIAFRLTQISRISAASRPTEGRLAIVTDAGRDAVDAAAQLTNSAAAYGQVVWF